MPEHPPQPGSPSDATAPAGASPEAERIASLAQRMAQFQTAIQGLELTRAELQRRRRGATDSVMVELDERLEVHSHALQCLQRGLELTRLELKRISTAYPGLGRSDRDA